MDKEQNCSRFFHYNPDKKHSRGKVEAAAEEHKAQVAVNLSEDNIRGLVTSGRTPILKGNTSKAGKKFNARLVLQDDSITAFEVEQKKKKTYK